MARKKEQPEFTEERMAELDGKAAEMEAALAPYSDNLPYNRDRVVSETRFLMEQTARGIFEVGKRLILLKANEGHGGFMAACEDIGIEPRTARNFMAAANKFAGKTETVSVLGRAKMYALLDVDDEELAEFETTGNLFGAARDEIDAMSARELKALVRKHKATIDKGRQQLGDKDARIKALEDKLTPPVFTTREEETMHQLREAHLTFHKAVLLADSASPASMLDPEGVSDIIKIETATLLIHFMQRAEESFNQLMQACPSIDLSGVDSAELPAGPWAVRMPGFDETAEQAGRA